jgi:predicted acyltransferase
MITALQETRLKRVMSIDALRGFDMLWIVGGSEVIIAISKACPNKFFVWLARQFDHEWGVFRFYDIIMPLFLFIVGVVMPVAFENRLARGESKCIIYRHILLRVLKLYILGLIASGHLFDLDINTLHLWTDTLHAIAVGYLVSSILILEAKLRWQIIVVASLLVAYWLIMTNVPVPGYEAGIFEINNNLALYIDDRLLGHFQEGAGWTYILTNMTFVCSVMLGVFAGYVLLSKWSNKTKLLRLAVGGFALIAAGLIWGKWFPIIHHIWTSPLVLFAGGWSVLLLVLFYYLIDVKGYTKWSIPFKVIGVNAIAVYVATHLFDFRTVAAVFVGGFAKWLGAWYGVLLALSALLIIWLLLYYMYKKQTFLKV